MKFPTHYCILALALILFSRALTAQTEVVKINFTSDQYPNPITGWVNLDPGNYGTVLPLTPEISIQNLAGLGGGNNGNMDGTRFPDDVARTYHYLADNNIKTYVLSGLNSASTYSIEIFSSRYAEPTPEDRITRFTAGSNTVSLNADGNVENTVVISGLSPDQSGTIELSAQRDANSAYGYINAIILYEDSSSPVYHTVTTSVAGTGGGIIHPINGSNRYLHGTVMTYWVTPIPTSVFTGWTGDYTSTDESIDIMVDKDINLIANFELLENPDTVYTVSVSTEGPGQVSLIPEGPEYPIGTTITLYATPDVMERGVFHGWEGDISGIDPSVRLTVDKDMQINAKFAYTPPPTEEGQWLDNGVLFTDNQDVLIKGDLTVEGRKTSRYKPEIFSDFRYFTADQIVADISDSSFTYGGISISNMEGTVYDNITVGSSSVNRNLFGSKTTILNRGQINGSMISVWGVAENRSMVTGDLIGIYGSAENSGTVQGNTWAGYFNGNTYIDNMLAIGTSTPTEALDVAGNAILSGSLQAASINLSEDITANDFFLMDGTPLLSKHLWNLKPDSSIFYNSGRIGIGTPNPNYELDVYGNFNVTGQYMQNGRILFDSPTHSSLSIGSEFSANYSGGSNVFLTLDNNSITSGSYNTVIGISSGGNLTSGSYNLILGRNAGSSINTGKFNVVLGAESGAGITYGTGNICIGMRSGEKIGGGENNIAFGDVSLNKTNGDNNIAIGASSLNQNTNGSSNIAIGENSGYNNTGSGNVFLGSNSGLNETGSNKLIIENSSKDKEGALIYGEFDNNFLRINAHVGIDTEPNHLAKLDVNGTIRANNFITNDGLPINLWKYSNGAINFNMGNVGIGCTNPTAKLSVNGDIHASGQIQTTRLEIKESVPCSDFVFEEDYELRSLEEVEEFVTTNKHLPEVPSAQEFKDNGYEVGEMDDLLLRKVEELTLYIIEQNKKLGEQTEKIEALQSELEKLKEESK